MNKTLAPLIISFAVIILLTFIIINSKPKGSAIELQTNGISPTMALNNISKSKQKRQEHAPAADYIVFHVELHAQVACSHEEMRQFSFELGKQLRRRLTKGISQALDDNEKSAL